MMDNHVGQHAFTNKDWVMKIRIYLPFIRFLLVISIGLTFGYHLQVDNSQHIELPVSLQPSFW